MTHRPSRPVRRNQSCRRDAVTSTGNLRHSVIQSSAVPISRVRPAPRTGTVVACSHPRESSTRLSAAGTCPTVWSSPCGIDHQVPDQLARGSPGRSRAARSSPARSSRPHPASVCRGFFGSGAWPFVDRKPMAHCSARRGCQNHFEAQTAPSGPPQKYVHTWRHQIILPPERSFTRSGPGCRR
jgi:hypothetical protein